MAKYKKHYKGEGGKLSPSPNYSEFYEFVFTHVSFVHQKCSNYALTNLLFGLCRFVWIIDPLVTCPSLHPKALTCPSTPEVLRTKERTLTLMFSLFSLLSPWIRSWVYQELGGASFVVQKSQHMISTFTYHIVPFQIYIYFNMM
jgi:hypothetical protein